MTIIENAGPFQVVYNNLQPFLALNMSVVAQGVYPSREGGAPGTFIGEVVMFAGSRPSGATADGRLLSISQNTALFSLLGTTYGGNGQTTFALPDLRGRVAVGTGTGLGLSPRDLGGRVGSESLTVTYPSHSHVIAPSGTATNTVFLSTTLNNGQPELALNYLIAVEGIFPTPDSGGDDSTPFLGEMALFAGNFAPRGWQFADGSLVSINQNEALFAVLGTTYGGDGQTTFALPDLRGRVPIGSGTGPGLPSYVLGEAGGLETVNANLGHSHTLGDGSTVGTTAPTTNFSNLQPFLALNYMIALEGIFPSDERVPDQQFLGEVRLTALSFAPRGWALAQGQVLSIAQNTALFSLLGTTYGGNGQTTFALPDLRGRAPLNVGQGPGLTNRFLGDQGGTTTGNLAWPNHVHTITDPSVNLSVSTTTGSEAGTTVITVTATASSAVLGNQTVTLGVSGTGITAGDYSLSNGGIITILNGQTTGTLTFTVVNDTLTEGTETATLTLSNPSAGITLGSTLTQNITLTDNDTPPTTANATLTLAEDTVFAFSSSQFPFIDADAGDTLQGIRITQLPTAGQLFLDANGNNLQDGGEAVAANQAITVAAISQLKFAPIANANGTPYTSFQFQVSDGSFLSTAPGTATLNVNPINDPPTGTVTITGTATQGQTLTAANTLADVDGIPGTITYQWKADGANISGATTSTLLLTQAQVGKAITVAASYTDGFGQAESVTSTATSAVANINDAPTGTVTITGTATQGQTLTAANTLADVDGIPGAITYQWKADGVDINGATNGTLLLTQAQVGKAITVTASYTDGGSTPESVTSTATSAVANINDAPTGTVTISGTTTQGQTLTAANTLADVDGIPGAITYQWKADGVDINSATNGTLLLTQAQVGKAITVAASYTDGFSQAESVTSTATTAVANINDLPTGAVTLSGIPKHSYTLTADASTVADIDGLGSFSYQWQQSSNGTDWISITGGTETTFLLTAAQVGQQVRSQISYTDGQTTPEVLASNPTATIRTLPIGEDLNGNGKADILWRHRTADQTVFWLMENTTFDSGDFLQPAAGDAKWELKAATDLDGDQDVDLLWQHKATGQGVYWIMQGTTFVSGNLLPDTGDVNWKLVSTGDFNSDDQTDLLWRHATSGENVVWLMNGITSSPEGRFLDSVADLNWEIGAVGDFTKNGQMEMFWRHRLSGEIAVWEMDGTNRQTGYLIGQIDPQWRMVGAADLTGDAKLDLLWQHNTADQLLVWQMNSLTVQSEQLLSDPSLADWLAVV